MRLLILACLTFSVIFVYASALFAASGDLVVEPDGITFSDNSPMEGDAVTITAVLRNQGDGNISEDIEVRFVEGDPKKGGLQIGSDALILGLKAGAVGKSMIKWRAGPGKIRIYVIADPDNAIEESNEDNNDALASIKGKNWKGSKVTEEQIKESIKNGMAWLESQQGEFYVTCSNRHDNFLYSAIAYGRCVICGEDLKGIEPKRIIDQLLFTLKPEFQSQLNNGKIPEPLQKEFEKNQLWPSPDTLIEVEEEGKKWLVNDELNRQKYSIRKENGKLDVYRAETMPGGWMSEIGPGMTSLALTVLLYGGVDEADPAIQKGINHLFNDAPVTWEGWIDSYDYAVGILALTATGDKEKYQDRVEFAVRKLEALQTDDGGWGYGAVADAAHVHYAVLGLYAAKQWGIEAKPDTWSRVAVWLTSIQQPDGGWKYNAGIGPFAEDSYGSMTATAIMSLKAAGISPKNESIQRGIKWLEDHYSITRNPGSFYWHYYYLLAVQRAMDMPPKQEKLGGHDWYHEMASILISKQREDGSWLAATPIYTVGNVTEPPAEIVWGKDKGDIMATSFATLFLIKAMPKPALPDVGLGPERITFSKAEPMDGEQVTIAVSLSNTGERPVEDVRISFYDGDPESGGVSIGVAQTPLSLSGGETKEASIAWKAAGAGEHRIYVVVDPDDSIQEFNEHNNVASGKIRVGGESTPAIPAMVKVADGIYKLGEVDLDLNNKTATVYGKMNMSYGLVELLACTRIGKLHESAMVIDVQPIHLQTALILLELEYEGGLRYQGDPRTPKGDRVRIWVEWDSDGQTKRYRAEDLVYNRETQSPMKYTDWVFTGSRINKNNVFMAQAVGTLITTFHDPDAIIDNPLPGGADDTVYIVNNQIAPPKGTPIKVIITPAASNS